MVNKFFEHSPGKRRSMSMKSIKNYLVVLVSFAVVFVGHAYIFAAEEASSIMCDNGTVNIGDMDVTVQDTCGEPNSKGANEWVYNFGPDQPVYTLLFKEGQLIKILEDEWGS
jgi:hypothetical protein